MRKSRSQLAQPAVPVRNIRGVVLGDIAFKTWYPSFYPEALVGKELETLYVCRSCFAYTNDVQDYLGHTRVCAYNESPPGRIIYTKDGISIYEIDGEEDKLFAQNLSLFAKLFLDNKSVFFDVIGFHYYLLVTNLPPLGVSTDSTSHLGGATTSSLPHPTTTTNTSQQQQQQQQRIVGFFSKEKLSWDLNNLACILVFPPWQRRGLGKILMGASYALSARERRIGGPEKPLSALGRRGYLSFWQARVANEVLASSSSSNRRGGAGAKAPTVVVEVRELAERCAMVVDDVILALREMAIVEKRKRKKDSGDGDGHGDGGDVVVSRAKVKEWAARTRADLRPPVDPEAFIFDDDEDDEQAEEEDEDDGEEGVADEDDEE